MRWNLLDINDRIDWNRTFLGMRWSNWCMVIAGVVTSAILLMP